MEEVDLKFPSIPKSWRFFLKQVHRGAIESVVKIIIKSDERTKKSIENAPSFNPKNNAAIKLELEGLLELPSFYNVNGFYCC